METINGLLTQKPDSAVPRIGSARRYSVTPRTSKNGVTWNKIKAEGEGYGELYEVITVEKTGFVDAHGNVSFNVDLVPLSGGRSAGEVSNNERAGKKPEMGTGHCTNPVPAQDFDVESWFRDYQELVMRAALCHEKVLPSAVIEKMSESEFFDKNQAAALECLREKRSYKYWPKRD